MAVGDAHVSWFSHTSTHTWGGGSVNTVWEKEKKETVETSILYFSDNVFYPVKD